jgi:hypothetical protein
MPGLRSRTALLILFLLPLPACTQKPQPDRIAYDPEIHPFFPEILADPPGVPSPWMLEDGTQIVTGFTRDGRYFLVPVTIENGDPLDYRNNQWWGKGKQLVADSLDFPTLARTGLHSTAELDQTETITGRAISEVTRMGRPESYSGAGFMSHDEDIISVLKGDNRLVRQLELTHPQCAGPLFHVFNLILAVRQDSERGNVGGILYNNREVYLDFWGSKGWQESIFDDEILGYWEIEMQRDLDQDEIAFLANSYPDLSEDHMAELTERLSYIHTGEMVPYYIVRYGFYEGHTSYRSDPIAIACIFSLRSLPEIEQAFQGRLYEVLTTHFSD